MLVELLVGRLSKPKRSIEGAQGEPLLRLCGEATEGIGGTLRVFLMWGIAPSSMASQQGCRFAPLASGLRDGPSAQPKHRNCGQIHTFCSSAHRA
jgi:hypothetical protein